MESKNPDAVVLKKMEALRYDHHHLVSPTGHGAGGLGLFWKQGLNLQVLNSNAHVIDTLITFEWKSFYSSFVHGSTERRQRNILWEQLIANTLMREEAWFITGDFNDLLSNTEKEGGVERPEGSFTDLRTFFSEGDLFDLQHSGDPLSWRGVRGNHLVRCRLDRAASNTLWAECFPTARCQYLEADLSSDHKPLLAFFDNGIKRRRESSAMTDGYARMRKQGRLSLILGKGLQQLQSVTDLLPREARSLFGTKPSKEIARRP